MEEHSGADLVRHHDVPGLVARLHQAVALGRLPADRSAITSRALAVAPWLSGADADVIGSRVISRLTGLGEITALLEDDSITDVLIDGPGHVVVERNGRLHDVDLALDSDGVEVLVERIMAQGRRRVDRHHPYVDVRLAGGYRANVVVAPAAVDGPYVSIRRFRHDVRCLSDMGPPEVVDRLLQAIANRSNILISGGTGSGKTTLLGLLLDACPLDHRVVTIEDVAEVRTHHRIVRLEAQPDDGEGRPQLTVRGLFRNALRMRPDRLVIGEIRGEEAIDLMQALGTGHRGSMSTIHADDPGSALRRLELLIASGGRTDPELVRSQIRAVVDLIVHVERLDSGTRLISCLATVNEGGLSVLVGGDTRW